MSWIWRIESYGGMRRGDRATYVSQDQTVFLGIVDDMWAEPNGDFRVALRGSRGGLLRTGLSVVSKGWP